jgi:hypothetical protein
MFNIKAIDMRVPYPTEEKELAAKIKEWGIHFYSFFLFVYTKLIFFIISAGK